MYVQTLSNNWFVRPLPDDAKPFQTEELPAAPDSSDERDEWLPIEVPSHWQQHPALEQHAGRVLYRCHFAAPSSAALPRPHLTRIWLRINGIFYRSQPAINTTTLGEHEGYFAPYEHDITRLLNETENHLLIEVDCPDEHNKSGKEMITGVFSHWDCLDPAANPGGIWLPVELHASGPVRLQGVRCHSETFNERFAQLRFAADLDAAVPGPVTLRWTIAPRTFDGAPQTIEQQRTLREGAQTIGGLLKLYEPRLWWTHDLGTPDLYTITLEVFREEQLGDHHSFAFGVRRFELRNWIPHLNGVRFMVKGSNYAPGDMRIATMTPERCEQDVRLARECHMNFLRVHAHVDHPALYDAADAAGILLWQDFPMQWLYRPIVLPEARRQASAMVHLLYNHPSVVAWCMHNEPIFVTDTADETFFTRLRTYLSVFGFSWNRDILDTQLKRVARREDPSRPVVRSSGEYALPWRRGTDSHFYFGWYAAYGTLDGLEKTRKHFKANLRFVTEFGAQSFPNVESCAAFMATEREQLDIDHLAERHSFQPDIMQRWIDWRSARSLPELVEMTQNYQIFINRFYIDRLRYHKYAPTGGIVPFMFCDSYPAILWSILDYWRVPKRSYHAMRLAFSPQYVFTLLKPEAYRVAESIEIPIYVVNDAQEEIEGMRLAGSLSAPDGHNLATIEHTLTLDADCPTREVDRLRLTPTLPGHYTLELHLNGGSEPVHQRYEIEVIA
jgi:beta-mannosidase